MKHDVSILPTKRIFPTFWQSGGAVLVILASLIFSATVRAQNQVILFNLTNSWKYNQTTSYDGSNWTARTFDDSVLLSGQAVLGVETNSFVMPLIRTPLTLGRMTYYFRTHFNFTNSVTGVSLTFSNIVDDGAVFYLNGKEIYRLFMTSDTAPVFYATAAQNHEASAYDVFTVSGPIIETNLLQGDNVLAVEVHQTTAGSSDIVWGCALSANFSELTPAPLHMPLNPPVYGYTTVNAFPSLANGAFGQPLCLSTPPGETNRLFVLDKIGHMYVVTNLANPNLTTFLDLSTRPLYTSSESGLLGVAFHPGYATNRYFFLFYSVQTNSPLGSGLHQRLSRFQTSPSNPNQGMLNSEVVLISQLDPAGNHNGGDLHFGADGLLYISLGDGGVQYDGSQNSQTITQNFFSAIMRLDVDLPPRPSSIMPNPHPANTNFGTINYRIPFDNPFIGATNFDGRLINSNRVRTEFYAVGFRNPWRMSFDRATGYLYCGDVGQDTWEEVDIITKGGNYGWAYLEGLHAGYRATNTVVGPLIPPIQEYHHGSLTNQGNSVTGGIVYRGRRLSQLIGWYVFADYVSGNIWILNYDGTNTIPFRRIANRAGVAGFGNDPSNDDVLMANHGDGNIYRLIYDTGSSTGAAIPPTLAETGAFTNLNSLTNQMQALNASQGLIPYDINVPFWSDNARKTRWFLGATNLKVGFAPEGNWTLPSGMAWVKHFDLEMTNGLPESSRRLETRVLVRNSNGVYGVTYRWGNSLTNATLVPEEGQDEPFTIYDGGNTRTQIWHYPARTECQTCHTPVAGLALGFNTVQMNRDFNYITHGANQIAEMSAQGRFTTTVSNIHSLRALAAATNDAVSLEWRVRSYLAANCAQCHQPGGVGLGSWTANISTLTANAGLISGPLNNNYGDANNRVIVPGSLSNSMLLTRISTRGSGQMPLLATSVLDNKAIQLLSAWITNDLPSYQTFAQWQVANFGSSNAPNAAPNFDADGDSSPNFSEYIARTDPQSSNSVWSISMSNNGGQVQLQFTQPTGRCFAIEESRDLFPPSWQFKNVPENRPFYPAEARPVIVNDSATSTQKFYRVKLTTP